MNPIRKAIVVFGIDINALNEEINSTIHRFTADGFSCVNVSAPDVHPTGLRSTPCVFVTLSFSNLGMGARETGKYSQSVHS